jgi:hypothetical protein
MSEDWRSKMNRGRFMAVHGNGATLHRLIDEKNYDALGIALDGARWKGGAPNPHMSKEHLQRIVKEFDPVVTGEKYHDYIHSTASYKLKKMEQQ